LDFCFRKQRATLAIKAGNRTDGAACCLRNCSLAAEHNSFRPF
jgi:hypothetical protein